MALLGKPQTYEVQTCTKTTPNSFTKLTARPTIIHYGKFCSIQMNQFSSQHHRFCNSSKLQKKICKMAIEIDYSITFITHNGPQQWTTSRVTISEQPESPCRDRRSTDEEVQPWPIFSVTDRISACPITEHNIIMIKIDLPNSQLQQVCALKIHHITGAFESRWFSIPWLKASDVI